MTVKELIEKLSKMPPDALVIIDMYSESQLLDDDEPILESDVIERNGTYMKHKDRWWDKDKDGEPKLLTVCWFPGN